MKDFFENQAESAIPNQYLGEFENGVRLWVKREDLLHPEVSGNKFRKLKYNLREAQQSNSPRILSFGGAFSNHIAALAAAGKELGLETLGIIRGDEISKLPKEKWSPTLKFAESCGMKLEFLSRQEYRNRNDKDFINKLRDRYGDFYLMPEGGTNSIAIKGCEEILKARDAYFDIIATSVGTGGTLAGLIKASEPSQTILGFPALRTDYLEAEVQKFVSKTNWQLINDYHFGGYAKINKELIDFMNRFLHNYKIQLDPIYTGKLVFGIFDLIKKNFFPSNSKVLIIHTGGLQGIQGMNASLLKKNMPQINVI